MLRHIRGMSLGSTHFDHCHIRQNRALRRWCLGTAGLIDLWLFGSCGVRRKSFRKSQTKTSVLLQKLWSDWGERENEGPSGSSSLSSSPPCTATHPFFPQPSLHISLIHSGLFSFSHLKLANSSTETNQHFLELSSFSLRYISLFTWCLPPCL